VRRFVSLAAVGSLVCACASFGAASDAADGGAGSDGGTAGDASDGGVVDVDGGVSCVSFAALPLGWQYDKTGQGNGTFGYVDGKRTVFLASTTNPGDGVGCGTPTTRIPAHFELKAKIAAPVLTLPNTWLVWAGYNCDNDKLYLHFVSEAGGLAVDVLSPAGGAHSLELGPSYYGSFHTFVFDVTSTSVSVSVDGSAVASLPMTGLDAPASCTAYVGADSSDVTGTPAGSAEHESLCWQ
jgi:hypothetical protein